MSDRLEDCAAWVLVVLGTLLAVVAVGAGVDAQARADAEARLRAAEQVEVTATVTDDSPLRFVPEAAAQLAPAPVTWTDPAGDRHEARTLVPAMSRAGDQVRIRVDGTGRPVAAIPGTGQLDAGAVVLAVVLLMGGAAALAVAWTGVRRFIARVNDRAWTREWARVGPDWTGHGGLGRGRPGTGGTP